MSDPYNLGNDWPHVTVPDPTSDLILYDGLLISAHEVLPPGVYQATALADNANIEGAVRVVDGETATFIWTLISPEDPNLYLPGPPE